MIVSTTLIILAYREYRWLDYPALSLILLADASAMDGMLYHLAPKSDFLLWVVPFYLHAAAACVGFIAVGMRLEPGGRLYEKRRLFYWLAAIAALFPPSSVFWLEKISLAVMWMPVNGLFMAMLIAQILPPFTWSYESDLQRTLTRLFPIGIVVFTVAPYIALQLMGTEPAQSQINWSFRLGLLGLIFFTFAMVIVSVITRAQQKEAAERAVLEAAKNEAELQLELERSERDYQRALSSAASSKNQLQTVSHDLRQAITSLRSTISRMQPTDTTGQDNAERLSLAVDYVDQLAEMYTVSGKLDALEGAAEQGAHTSTPAAPNSSDHGAAQVSHAEPEPIAADVFINAMQQMFARELSGNNARMTSYGHKQVIAVQPLPMMRVLSNLISNVLRHAQATRLVLAFRPRGQQVLVQVVDNGQGLPLETIDDVFAKGARGDDSEGDGLGLSIVQALCGEHGYSLSFSSEKGSGTTMSLIVPKG